MQIWFLKDFKIQFSPEVYLHVWQNLFDWSLERHSSLHHIDVNALHLLTKKHCCWKNQQEDVKGSIMGYCSFEAIRVSVFVDKKLLFVNK